MEGRNICKCQPEISRVFSTVIGIVWSCTEGEWEEAMDDVELRLKPRIKELEKCLGKELPYTREMVEEKITERIKRKDLDHLLSGVKTFTANSLTEIIRKSCSEE